MLGNSQHAVRKEPAVSAGTKRRGMIRLYMVNARKSIHKGNKEACCCSGSRKLTHHEILPVRTRGHISCGEGPPGDVSNGRRRIHPGHHHQPHKGHSLVKSRYSELLSHSEGCEYEV
eukprot:1150094-Pelagomonas_calceolata.AAC.3